jgi:cytochrome c oxidase subunit 1
MATLAPPLTAESPRPSIWQEYVVDPFLGFAVPRSTRRLMLAFLFTAFAVIFLGALAAALVVLTRAPAVELLDPDAYYKTLTYHGVLMLTMFPHLFESALWIYTCTVLLRTRIYSERLGWLAYGLILTGAVLILGSIWSGQASVLYTTYVPLRAYPLFYVGHVVYAVGLLLVLTNFVLSIARARLDGLHVGSLPLATYGMATSAIIGFVAIVSAVVAFVPTTLWAFRILDLQVDPLVFKAAFWGMGHTLQYTNVTGMVVAWYMISAFALRARPVSEKFSRYAFALYLLTTVPVFAHHLLVDPTWTPAFKWFGATFVGILLGIASSAHGVAVPASVERTLRLRGSKGLFGFLRDWGWKNPAMVLLFFSVCLFGVGGFDGTVATTSQLNMILHNTMWIPAHIHGALAGGMAVAYMGVSYYLLPAIGVPVRAPHWLRLTQAYMAGLGFLFMSYTMHRAAELGVPRRTQDIAYAGAGAPVPDWFATMNWVGLAGSITATAVMLFGIIMIVSVIAGLRQRGEPAESDGRHNGHTADATLQTAGTR